MFIIYLLTPIVDKYFPKSFSPNGIKYRFEVYIIKVHMNIMLFLCFFDNLVSDKYACHQLCYYSARFEYAFFVAFEMHCSQFSVG